MQIRFAREAKPVPHGVTARRVAAARRALDREQRKYGLFAEEVKASQPTPEERVRSFERRAADLFRDLRKHSADCWRWGRRMLRSFPEEHRAAFIDRWNAHGCPATGVYFATVLRSYAGENSLPLDK